MSAPPSAPSAPSAAAVDAKLDAICRRQQGRFLGHLRETRQATPKLEGDVIRFVRFVFDDVKAAIHETTTEARHDQAAKQ